MSSKKKKKLPKQLKLNIGCGDNKLEGYINIDGEKLCKPDLVLNIVEKKLPFETESVSEVVMFHCIEHIRKIYHPRIFTEINRVLTLGSKFYLSYPNFWECAKRWRLNVNGERRFWEATLFGRQLYPGDYHVCAMSPDELAQVLHMYGFVDVTSFPESKDKFNSVTISTKGSPPLPTYEDVVAADIRNMQVRRSKVCR